MGSFAGSEHHPGGLTPAMLGLVEGLENV